jgi:transcription initiation factor IIE alpha subunit
MSSSKKGIPDFGQIFNTFECSKCGESVGLLQKDGAHWIINAGQGHIHRLDKTIKNE